MFGGPWWPRCLRGSRVKRTSWLYKRLGSVYNEVLVKVFAAPKLGSVSLTTSAYIIGEWRLGWWERRHIPPGFPLGGCALPPGPANLIDQDDASRVLVGADGSVDHRSSVEKPGVVLG
jgi:hypothetical protein